MPPEKTTAKPAPVACLRCRARKDRCIPSDDPSESRCKRCVRESIDCVFTESGRGKHNNKGAIELAERTKAQAAEIERLKQQLAAAQNGSMTSSAYGPDMGMMPPPSGSGYGQSQGSYSGGNSGPQSLDFSMVKPESLSSGSNFNSSTGHLGGPMDYGHPSDPNSSLQSFDPPIPSFLPFASTEASHSLQYDPAPFQPSSSQFFPIEAPVAGPAAAESPFSTSDEYVSHMIHSGFSWEVTGGRSGGWRGSLPRGAWEEKVRERGLSIDASAFENVPAVEAEELKAYHEVMSLVSPPTESNQMLPTPPLIDRLFTLFFQQLHLHSPTLDPFLHTPANTLARSPFLAAVVCLLTAKMNAGMLGAEAGVVDGLAELVGRLAESCSSARSVEQNFRVVVDSLTDRVGEYRHARNVETIQAYLLLALWTPKIADYDDTAQQLIQVRRAAALAHIISLPLQSTKYPYKPLLGISHEREILNAERTWIFLFCLDRSTSYRLGVPTVTQEDYIIDRACSRVWSTDEEYQSVRNPEDTAVAAYMHLQKVISDAVRNLKASTTHPVFRMQVKNADDEVKRWESICPFFVFTAPDGTPEATLTLFLRYFVAAGRLALEHCCWSVAGSDRKYQSEVPAVSERVRQAAMLVCKLMTKIAKLEVPMMNITLRSLHTFAFDSVHWDVYLACSILLTLCGSASTFDENTKIKMFSAVTYTVEVLNSTAFAEQSVSTHVARRLSDLLYGTPNGNPRIQ